MDRCVCCGDIIPEGTQVCWSCKSQFKRTSHTRQQNPRMKHKPRYFRLLQGTERVINCITTKQ